MKNCTSQFPIQTSTAFFNQGLGGTQDVCTIHCCWPFRHRRWGQAGASAVSYAYAGGFLHRIGGLLALNWWSSWSLWLPLSRGGSNGTICASMGRTHVRVIVDPKPFLFGMVLSTFFCLLMFIFAPQCLVFLRLNLRLSLVASLWCFQLFPVPWCHRHLGTKRFHAAKLASSEVWAAALGGFRKWGYPNSWMVYCMEHPSTKWMILLIVFWGTPMTLEPACSKEDLANTDGGFTIKNLDRTTKTGRSTTEFGRFLFKGPGRSGRRSFPRLSLQSRCHS